MTEAEKKAKVAKAKAKAKADMEAKAKADAAKSPSAKAAAAAKAKARAKAKADADAAKAKAEEVAAAAKVKADADAAAAKADADRTQTNKQLFLQVMGSYFDLSKDGTWINSLFDSAKKFYDQGITGDAATELLLRDDNAPKAFTDRFRLFLDKDKADIASGKKPRFGNIATFLAYEGAIGDKLSSYGTTFQKLNTQENINKFIAGDVAPDEVGRRIDNAYYAIKTADAELREQINSQFPSLTDDDLAFGIVTGDTDSIQQKIKFGAAEIAASAKKAGYTPVSNLEDLSRQLGGGERPGYAREVALRGFERVAAERTGIQQASRMFGGTAPTQAELEAEALGTGVETKEARRLRSQARAQFGGTSGVVTGSLGRKKQV
jgi:hypothetical protein